MNLGQTTDNNARRLSAYNVVEGVAMTTIYGGQYFCTTL